MNTISNGLYMKAMNIKPNINIFQGLRVLEILHALQYNDINGYGNTNTERILMVNFRISRCMFTICDCDLLFINC